MIEKIKKLMESLNINQMYIPSYDQYLSEYVPRRNNLRYYVSGFTGSVAEVLINKEGKSHLFIDGRYTEQAAKEVSRDHFEIHTCKSGSSPFENMCEFIASGRLGFVAERTRYADFIHLKKDHELINIETKTIEEIVGLDFSPNLNPIEWTPPEKGGVETLKKLHKMNIAKNQAYFVTALDSVAWLTNGRGYHQNFQSSYFASVIAFHDHCVVFIDESIRREKAWTAVTSIKWVTVNTRADYEVKMKAAIKENGVSELCFDPAYVNACDFLYLNQMCELEALTPVPLLVTAFQSIKYPEEIHIMKDEFLKASKAIYGVINWTKENYKKLSELDVYNETSRFYREQGGHTQSFNTISGFGANGSIIHYGNPSADVGLSEGELFLLDSGGYFESGFATDKTRTFLIGETVNKPLYKEIYTLVLKGLLNLQYAKFKEGTLGSELDAIARAPLKAHGYDYNHGTGHGVGVNVHEGGVRIHTTSHLPMKQGQVVSLEPGIYLPGIGGVRLENIAIVVKDEHSDLLRFENMVFIGFDHNLIDESLLTVQEKTWLSEYESECQKMGLAF